MDSNSSFFVAQHRFGYGPKGGQTALSGDVRAGLLNQLKETAVPAELSGLPRGSDLLGYIREFQEERKAFKDDVDGSKDQLKDFARQMASYYLDELDVRFRILATTDAPFLERLAWFWNNHFSVSGEKHVITPLLGAYDREALRPHICGNFSDMLKSAVQHPAMIMYLDNQTSISPEVGEKRKKNRARRGLDAPTGPTGLNENLAREIMELHTLGVDGGYTQSDVTAFAHVLTGWNVRLNEKLSESMDSNSDNGTGFGFAEAIHDNTPQTILNKSYDQRGMAQGEAVLNDLAHHPATARHIAHKLAQHFVSDTPPANLVERLTHSFISSGGHLPTLYKTLIESEEAWHPQLIKAKTHIEYVASTLRLFPAAHPEVKKIAGSLKLMGQRPWFALSPQGWPDVSTRWITPDGLWKRVEWVQAVAAKAGKHVDARALADKLYGPLLSTTTREGIGQAESGEQAMALLILSPEFQRR